MKIVVDTNIIFSTLLNTDSHIGNMLLDIESKFEFYSCSYMRIEIQNHWKKLKAISKLTDEQLQTSYIHIISRINFIDEALIPSVIWRRAEAIASPIDIDDLDFIALCIFMDAGLWTGDKNLYNVLKSETFINSINTQDMKILADKQT